ncbi:T9SS type A sorting domain-containing protein [Flaviaesturariibacter flavus]|uniref:T9SS type A sorting domain-containing protein n=1 Tax=Flaviaesturariibacter flavus TaxID=2502780 RepID=A0A4R1BKD2_9BACT|nr:T9SS type A sorting domain-containing protein [Flaviaesturariibacter flavus]TCJ17737.1 T9SS type A sorting domain-containing protein [Flaviaesturariibacter flavus]
MTNLNCLRRVTALLACLLVAAVSFAQTGTANGTYNWSSIGAADGGGTGFKLQGDKFKVSNILQNDVSAPTTMYAGTGAAGAGVTQSVTIKAEGGSVMKTFTLQNMSVFTFQNARNLNVLTITLYDYSGVQIAQHSLSGVYQLPATGTSLTSIPFSTPWPAGGYNLVNSITLDYQYATTGATNFTFQNITLANISAATPTTLTLGTISGTTFCAGSSLSIPFTASGFNSGNTFTAQLSDASGSFTSPTTIGSVTSTSSGTLPATIPAGQVSGTGYRIRIVGSNPSFTSSNNGTNLTINAKPSASITSFTDVSCFGGSNGSLSVTASGGTPTYGYSWSPAGGTAATASNLSAGSYTVTVTDSKGCQAAASRTVTQPASALSASTVVTNVACFGGNTGTINLTPTGGTGPYTFNYGGGVTSEDRMNLTAGTYGVTITDNKGCQFTLFPISVTQPSAPVSGSTVVTNVSCFGGNTGAINLTPSGGTGPYTFLWNNGATTEDRTGLVAGTYSVTITDANDCQAAVSNIIVGQPASAVSGSTTVTNVSCFGGNTGSIDLTPAGGTPGYTFLWNNGTTTTEDRSNLVAGNYSVTITDSKGCQATVSNISVTQPATPVSATTVVTNIACFGGNTGAVNLTPSGGTGPYTFLWNNGATTEDRTSLTAGTYSVTITDAKGCQSTLSNITVSQPASALSGGTLVTNVSCFGGNNGSIDLTPAGGTPGYTYLWNNGSTTTQDRVNLPAGTYSVTITDANGCQAAVSNITVSQPASAVSGSTVVGNIPCYGGTVGFINLTPAGGTPGYTYLWNNGTTATEDRTGLAAGTYSVTITDANGCTGTVNNIVVGEPAAPVSGSTVVTNVACFGGTTGAINLTPAGGTPGYTYSWSDGATTEDRTGLAAGTYSVTIIDANSCQGSVVNIVVSGPAAAVSGSTVVTDATCAGGDGAINLTPAGGTAPYTFNWNDGAATEDRTGLAAGTYTVTITDANGCTGSAQATVASAGSVGTMNPVSNQTVCSGGNTATNSFSGAGAGVTYNWTNSNNAIGLAASGSGNIASFTAANGGTTNIVATITVTPTSGACTGTPVTFTITVKPAPTVNAVSSQTVCAGSGTAAVNFSGPLNGTSYSWTNSNTSIGLAASGSGTINAFTAVNSGTNPQVATFTVTPFADGCSGIPASFTITVNPLPTVNAVSSQTVCNGASTAAVAFTGNLSGTDYSWTNSNTAIGLAAGGSGNIPAFTATNNGTAPISGTITVTPVRSLLNYRIFSTHYGNGGLGNYGQYVYSSGDFDYVFSLNQPQTSLYASGQALPSQLLPFFSSGDLTANGIPVPNGGDYYGVEITGTFVPKESGSYQFIVDGDDAVEVSINGALVAGNYGPHGFNGGVLGSVNLTAGTSYSFRARMQEYGGGDGMSVTWKRPSQNTFAFQTDEFGGCAGTPVTYTYTVNPTPTVNAVANQALCAGDATTAVTFGSPVSGAAFSWTNSNTATGLAASGTGNIPSFTATNGTNAPIVGTITVTPQANSCSGTPSTFTITVNPVPTATLTVAAQDQYVCTSGGSTNINVSGGPAFGSIRYNVNGGATQTANLDASGSVQLPTGALTANTTYTVTSVSNTTCTTSLSQSVTVYVGVISVSVAGGGINREYCAGATAPAQTYTGNFPAGTQYTWTVRGGLSIGMNASDTIGTGAALPSFVAQNATNQQISARVSVIPVVTAPAGCKVVSQDYVIRVNPLPQVQVVAGGNQVVCAGTATAPIQLLSSLNTTSGVIQRWTSSNPAVGGAITGGATPSASFIPSFTAQNNSGSATIATTYTITPYLGSCAGPAITTTLSVNRAVGTITYAGGPGFCQSLGVLNPRLTGGTGGTFSYVNLGTGTVAGLSFNTATGAVNTVSSQPGNYRITYSFSGAAGGCGGTTTTDISIQPGVGIAAQQNLTVCAGQPLSITFTSPQDGQPGISYIWGLGGTNSNLLGVPLSGTGNTITMTPQNPTASPIRVLTSGKVSIAGGGAYCGSAQTSFYITVNPCGPITQSGDTGAGGSLTARTAVAPVAAEAGANSALSVGPNPTQGRTTVFLRGEERGKTYSVQLLSQQGAVLSRPAAFSGDRHTVDLTGLPAGVYLLQLTDTRSGKTIRRQVVKL